MLVPGADVADVTWHGEAARAFGVNWAVVSFERHAGEGAVDFLRDFVGEMAKLFCMQFALHAAMLFLQRSAVLYPAEHFRENGRHFPFNN